jgi:hypothetical protein
MNLFKRLFKQREDIYTFTIIELDKGDAMIVFDDDGGVKYVVDLDWDNGVMDVEFRVYNDETANTTNLHRQYKILRTVSSIVRTIIGRIKEDFHTITFKSSRVRDGKLDDRSGIVRNNFFIRYVLKEYPNSKGSEGERGIIIINLK